MKGKASDQPEIKQLADNLKDQYWRICNLYWIRNKDGDPVPFEPNFFQKYLLKSFHTRNIILKARQLGFSTLIDIFILDCMLFEAPVTAGIIDRSLPDAKKKLKIIQFAFDHLGEKTFGQSSARSRWLKSRIEVTNCSKTEFAVKVKTGQASYESMCYASTTFRGGTLQILHLTEYAKICKKYPGKALEINPDLYR